MTIKSRPRCPVQHKAMYRTERDASTAMFRVWSHNPSLNIYDMHTYFHDDCGAWHFGHISYYQKQIERQSNERPGTPNS